VIIALNVAMVLALVGSISILFTNENFEWATVFQYLFSEQVLAACTSGSSEACPSSCS
jgi:hypothetical protein